MIDNFELLQRFYSLHEDCSDADKFLFGQILVRSKDGSEFSKSNNRVVKDLVFRTPDDFQNSKKEIAAICNTLQARAYVNVNPRSFSDITVEMAGICLDYIRTGGEVACRSAFATACGRSKPKRGYWVVDVDDIELEQRAADLIPNIALRVPTANGVHLLAKGFDLRVLRRELPSVDVHRNNPTLLYMFQRNVL